MFFSTKGRYGLMAVHEIAQRKDGNPVPLSEISKKLSISLGYLEQIFLVLRKKGIVTSIRGAKGGYELAKKPSEISVGDILSALEGPVAAADCARMTSEDGEDGNMCDYLNHCATRGVFLKITEAVNEVMESTSLEDMVDKRFYVDSIECNKPNVLE